jgi:CubicO group peptidase (beta-lactamase class C family)
MRRPILPALAWALAAACASSAPRAPSPSPPTSPAPAPPAIRYYFPPPGESLDVQSRKRPEDVGLDPAVIARLGPKGGDRWALWRHGHLVHVHGDFNHRRPMASLRKTWHAMAVGAALKQGRLDSLDRPIATYRPDLRGKDARATFRHVLTQSSGFDFPGCGDPTDYAPGEVWSYSDLNLVELCHAMARIYGRRDYLDDYTSVMGAAYFDAIGLRGHAVLPATEAQGFDGIRFEFDLEDMGRLGLLALARGTWSGVELVPRAFVEALETTQTRGMKVNDTACSEGGTMVDWKPSVAYGYLTWNNGEGRVEGADRAWAWAHGKGNNRIFWHHGHGLVIAGMGIGLEAMAIAEAAVVGPNPLARP